MFVQQITDEAMALPLSERLSLGAGALGEHQLRIDRHRRAVPRSVKRSGVTKRCLPAQFQHARTHDEVFKTARRAISN
jgi:hypothetical protein